MSPYLLEVSLFVSPLVYVLCSRLWALPGLPAGRQTAATDGPPLSSTCLAFIRLLSGPALSPAPRVPLTRLGIIRPLAKPGALREGGLTAPITPHIVRFKTMPCYTIQRSEVEFLPKSTDTGLLTLALERLGFEVVMVDDRLVLRKPDTSGYYRSGPFHGMQVGNGQVAEAVRGGSGSA